MNKVYGKTESYVPRRVDTSRTIISYGIERVDETYSTWYEIYFYKKPHPVVTFEEVKEAILSDINAQTDEKILKGFVWQGKNVWLSAENQRNFSEAQRVAQMTNGASLPVKFKLGEDNEGSPVYHTFNTIEELDDFYLAAVVYIQQCLNKGWELKDNIDWNDYKITEA